MTRFAWIAVGYCLASCVGACLDGYWVQGLSCLIPAAINAWLATSQERLNRRLGTSQ